MTLLTRTSLKNRLIVGLITAAVALFGIISMSSLKQELMPSMTAPMAFVSIDSQGLAPEEMSRTVTEPAEQSLMAVSGVKRVTSTTSTGSAQLQVEWDFGGDDEETLRQVKNSIEGLKPILPDGTETQVFSGGTDGIPALVISAGSTKNDADFGERIAQTVVPALKGVSGVQRVELAGREEQRIVIDLRPADVDRLKVETATIQALLQSYGSTMPAGEAPSTEGKISVTVGQGIASIEDLQNLPVTNSEGNVVRIADFADVHMETVPQGSLSRVNGKSALTLQVMAAQGANVVDISHAVNAELDRLAPVVHAEFVSLFDQAPYIEQSIHDLSVEGGLGLFFAVIVILAFLGSWRSTVIAAVSIPLSLLITLIGLLWSGNTLNILTLGALTIAIGRVVDDSIVVIENISRRRGDGPLTIEGVVASVRQVAGAITASTLTTVAVFAPIAFVSGMAGQLFRPFAITVTIALLASLLVALTVVPVLAYWFMQKGRKGSAQATAPAVVPAVSTDSPIAAPAAHSTAALDETTAPTAILDPSGAKTVAAPQVEPHHEDDLAEIHTAPDRLQRAIMPVLSATRRHPVITIVVSVVLLVATLGMSSLIRTDFLGSSGAESLQLMQTPPKKTDDLVKAAEPVERALEEVDGVQDVVTNIPLAAQGGTGAPLQITYDVMLKKGADAEATGDRIEKAMERVRDIGEVQLLTQDAFVGSAGNGINLQIRGNDPKALREASELLEKKLKGAAGVQAVRSELAGEQPVVRVKLNELNAAKIGYDPTSVAQAIRNALEGQTIGKMLLDGSDRSIMLRTPGSSKTAEELGALMLPVTPQQTAEARKLAADKLTADAEAAAERARNEASAEMSSQISEANSQRAEMVAQIAELNAQLQALLSAPLVPGSDVPADIALEIAQRERAEQVAALQSALAGAQGGIEGIDQQISALRSAQGDAANALAEQQKAEAEQKAAMEVNGTAVPLSAIAEVTEELTAPMITRADGDRQVALTVTPKKGQLDRANVAVQNAIDTVELPAGVSFELGGVSAEQDEAFAQLFAAMLAAILLVMLVMVATFRSFRGPFVLLVSIPFAATGALLGLLLTGTPLGLPAMIGLLMLIGIVVTNAIVLMDLINRLREAGAPLEEAVEHGTRLRLRPILMTAAATIFALVPMSLGLTGGGVFISKPLAIVVIGGLISSTLLTLVLVPILYTLVERRYLRKTQKRADRRERREEKRAAKAAGKAQGQGQAESTLDELIGEA